MLGVGDAGDDFFGVEFSADEETGDDPFGAEVFGVFDLEAQGNGFAGGAGGGKKMFRAEADNYVTEFGKVHGRGAEKGGGEGVGGGGVDFGGGAGRGDVGFVEDGDGE